MIRTGLERQSKKSGACGKRRKAAGLDPDGFHDLRQRVCAAGIERTAYSATGTKDFHVTEKFGKLWGK